jgi:hypothetical protein
MAIKITTPSAVTNTGHLLPFEFSEMQSWDVQIRFWNKPHFALDYSYLL